MRKSYSYKYEHLFLFYWNVDQKSMIVTENGNIFFSQEKLNILIRKKKSTTTTLDLYWSNGQKKKHTFSQRFYVY
jgi:hypothetical protein